MKIIVAETYEAMSKQAAKDVTQLVSQAKQPLVCAASGDSPAGLYRELAERVATKQSDISNWNIVSLDEWAGMNGDDEGSCRYHLNDQFFNPLQIPEKRICFFDGKANDLQLECSKVESFITAHGGIDVAIVGLGMNGHVGMNEPGASAALRSHVADIAPATQKVGQKYFKEPRTLTQGITLGLATIMEAKHIVLLVSGKHKAEIVKQALEGEPSEAVPASLLRNHPDFKVYLDRESASMLDPQGFKF